MKLKSFIFVLALSSLLVGCATPKNNYQAVTLSISEPPLNSVNTKEVGDEMLKQGKYREHDAIYVTTEIKPHWAYTVHPGYFLKSGEDESNEYYRIGGAGEESGFVEKAAIADNFKSLLVIKIQVLCALLRSLMLSHASTASPKGLIKSRDQSSRKMQCKEH